MSITKRDEGRHSHDADQIGAFRFNAWDEVVGAVEEVRAESVVLTCNRRVTVQIGHQELETYSNLLRKGTRIGILKLDDGSIRIRRAQTEAKSHSAKRK